MKAWTKCTLVIRISERKDIDDYQIMIQTWMGVLSHCDATAEPARHIPNCGMITPHLRRNSSILGA